MSNELEAILSKGKNSPKMSDRDICKIIKTARQYGVSELIVGDVSVKFHEPDKSYSHRETESVQPDLSATPKAKPMPLKQPTIEEIAEAEEQALLEANVLAKEAELEQLLITDPEKYEELIAQGDLKDGPATEEDPLDS